MKTIALIMTLGGAIALVVGVLGIFGSMQLDINVNPWAFAILGVIFFFAGISLLKYSTKSSNN